MAEEDTRKYEELRLLYSVTISDILEFKQQQWRVTNYGLLLYAAIASISQLLDNMTKAESILLWGLGLAVMISGWILIGMFHASLIARWERLTEIRQNHFSEEFRVAWRGGRSSEIVPDDPGGRISLVPFFQAIFLIGFLFDTWFIYRMYSAV